MPGAEASTSSSEIPKEEKEVPAQEEEEKEIADLDDQQKTIEQNSKDTDASEDSKGKDKEKTNGTSEANLEGTDFTREARNRVKLYVLCDQRWDDRGTGHVACLPTPDQPGFHCIIVRLESTEKNVLESRILMDTVYQKQQDTLIVWSESDTSDLALSFQERAGCDEIWTKICEVQGKDPGDVNNESDDMEESFINEGSSNNSASYGSGKGSMVLPPVEMGRLNEIEMVLGNSMGTAVGRDRVAMAVENTNYISRLCDVFRMCEDVENAEGLKTLYTIAKRLFMLNKNNVIESLVHDDHLKDVIGMLEYDPSLPKPRPHRQFLYEKARFRQILPMEKPQLKEKIHHTYRVQYVQDVCLPAPSLFEENLLSALNSFLFFARVDIVTMLQEDKILLRELFTQLKDPSTSIGRRRDLSLFLKELCAMSQSLQQSGPQSREIFYKTLVQNDVLAAFEPCMRSTDLETRAAITEMLNMIVEFSPQTVRDFLIRQSKGKADNEVLMNLLLEHIVSDSDCEMSSACEMLQVMRKLLDPENMSATQKGDKSEILNLFYHRCIHTLVRNLVASVKDGVPVKDDYHTAKQFSLVLRLMNFFITRHAYQMRTFVINNDFLNKVLVLLKSQHHFLALYALKLLRSVVQQKDEFYLRYVIKEKVFDRVIDCFDENGKRNNLLNSAIIELFEYLRTEDMKALIAYVVEHHWTRLEKHAYVKTFHTLKTRHEQHLEREKEMDKREEGEEKEKWRKEREVDAEEQWFDRDDDEDEEEKEEKPKAPQRKSGSEPMFASLAKLRSPLLEDDESEVFSGGTPSLTPTPIAVSPKILIKVEGVRSRSPSPGTIPREDEVSSSQAPSSFPVKRSASTSPIPSPTPKRGLVEYDDSDSDDDEEGPSTSCTPSNEGNNDSVPSSSTGSPEKEEEEKEKEERDDGNVDDNDDVSSTIGDDELAYNGISGGRKRRSSEPSCEADTLLKRQKCGSEPPSSAPRPSPPPVDPVAQ